MQLIISGNSANELKKNLANAYAEFYGVNIDSAQTSFILPKTSKMSDNDTATTESTTEGSLAALTSKGKKKTTKPKTSAPVKSDELAQDDTTDNEHSGFAVEETTVEEESVSAPVKGNTAMPSTVVFTKEDFIQALSKVNTKLGIDAARKLLTKFGAKKSSDITKEQYSEFIAACDEMIG